MELPSAIVSYPPRAVPLSTWLVVLFGGMFATLGWIFTGVGLIFVILFAGNADFSPWFSFRGTLETAPGIITSSEKTRASEGGSKNHKGTPIFAHHFNFSFCGTEYSGTSYCTGGGGRDHQAVTVEFPAGKPKFSRIQGMRRAVFGPEVAFVFIFPLIGLVFVAASLRTGLKNASLLINGKSAQARNTGKEVTRTRINNRMVYKVWFEFADQTGALQNTFTRTSTPEKLEGSVFEQLFYDATNPTRAILLHSLPATLTLDERGRINPCSVGSLIAVLWAPALAVLFVITSVLIQRTY